MELLKKLLLSIGSRLNGKSILALNSSLNYLETGYWLKQKGFSASRIVPGRAELFDEIGARIGHKRVLYLEFGVSGGQSLRYWSKMLKNPLSRLHGFDTFDGLPFGWQGGPVGEYSRNGQPPQIDDSRIEYFTGLFEETLTHYAPPRITRCS